MGELTAIVVGLGNRGWRWLDEIARWGGVRPVAGVDVDAFCRNRARRYLGSSPRRVYPTLPMALRHCRADVAIVCTPLPEHERGAAACLRAGMAVLLEKPFAPSAEAAHRLIQTAGEVDRPLIIAQNARHSEPEQTMSRALADGLIGEVGFAECSYHRRREGRESHRADLPLACAEICVHHFDNFRQQFGAEPLAVRARAFDPPWSGYAHGGGLSAMIRFGGNIHVSYLCSWVSRRTSYFERIEGSEGCLTCDGARVRYVLDGRRRPQKVRRAATHPLDRRPVPLGGMHALLEEMRRALDGDRNTPNSARNNLPTLGTMLACMISDREGREVTIEEALGG